MLVGCLAPVALAVGGYGYSHGWWVTTASVAVMSATGFFVLPAMQVLILEDFKHMSGLAAGVSKLVMTLISTGGSIVVTDLYDKSEGGSTSGGGVDLASWKDGDECPLPDMPLGRAPPQFLLWSLCIYMIGTQVVFWVGYVVCGNICGFMHTAPSLQGASPPIVRAGGLSSPHVSAVAQQGAAQSVKVAAHSNGAPASPATRRA